MPELDKRTATITVDLATGQVLVTMPYKPAAIAELKFQIPSRYRQYNAELKRWEVSVEYAPHVTRILEAYYERIQSGFI